MFAAFGDSRLPEPYQGDDSRLEELPWSVLEAGQRMRSFSAETQAELAPFFLPPGEPDSWINLSTVSGECGRASTRA